MIHSNNQKKVDVTESDFKDQAIKNTETFLLFSWIALSGES